MEAHRNQFILTKYTGIMKLGAMISGGKDSLFALNWALQQGWDVKCLITIRSKNKASYMFHTPNVHIVEKQAESIGIPLIYADTQGEKELELKDLKKALVDAQKKYKITGIVVGAVASDYQEERFNRICAELNLKTYSPLWHKNQKSLLQAMIKEGFDIRISQIAAHGFTKKWLGRKIDLEAYKELLELNKKYGTSIMGEGGEYESLVVNAPFFKHSIQIKNSKIIMENECTGVWVVD